MANNGQLEPYMIRGLELLRSNDPNALNEMFKHFEEACKEHYGENRRPTNAAKNMTVPAALFASVERLKVRGYRLKRKTINRLTYFYVFSCRLKMGRALQVHHLFLLEELRLKTLQRMKSLLLAPIRIPKKAWTA